MKALAGLLLASQLLLPFVYGSEKQWPLKNDGETDLVQWDHYSMTIDGERLFVWSGEMHYWRIPVPELWVDILQKIKAAGFNTVSFYSHWGFHSASNGTLDFETGAHNITSLFEICHDIGLYILFRPGPYINAETTAGGFPPWVTTGEYGTLRNDDSRYTAAWTPYFEAVSKIVAEHQITKGGNVAFYQIENEYGQQWTNISARTPNETAIAYMELLEASANSSGIEVPTLHNNPNLNTRSWSTDYDVDNVGGDTWLYGLDHYPSCWSCDLSECTGTNGVVPDFTLFDYYTNFQTTAPTMPSFLVEFQGGAYNPWTGPVGGCTSNTGPDWVNVFYRHNIGQKVTAQNIYMIFGGTNWGGLAFPTVGTSYDYSAPIAENRLLGDKYSETKLMSYFIRAAKDLNMVERGANGTNLTTNADVFTQVLYNVEKDTRFYQTVHANSTLQTVVSFKQKMTTSVGPLLVPQYAPDIVLNGRQSKILVSDFAAGSQNIIYSTAEVLTVSIIDFKTVIVLWVPTGESGEFYLEGINHGSVTECKGCSNTGFYPADKGIITKFTQAEGMTVFEYENGMTVLVLDRSFAYKMWQPVLTNDPHVPLDKTILVLGPYLVRTASTSNDTLAITGDYNGTTTIEIFAPSVKQVTFNGEIVIVKPTDHNSIIGTLSSSDVTVASLQASLPALTAWKVKDSLPERFAEYNDSGAAWVNADHNTTLHPVPPATYPVLFADEYGFHTGPLLWRGRFAGNASGVFLNIIGGKGSGWSAWLNGVFLGSSYGNTTLSQSNQTLEFPVNSTAKENVLFIIQDHMGKDETAGALDPRGILNATLLGASHFTSWKLAGKAGGQANIDPIRGPLAEGGLTAERLGWHLPGFDDSNWKSSSSIQLSGPGVKFYRTMVPLDMPSGHDISLAFELSPPTRSKIRVQLYVNGYQFGKSVPYIGNQIEFPVFPGILDYLGNNTIGLSIWTQDNSGGEVGIEMKVLGIYKSGFDVGFDGAYLRPGWTVDRSKYV
ncbi:hypothetical protein AAFC00_001943 [Neodothiora populina]|uniref:beta-galactosidase n=1 Tax=Neodothiora populina TaxID=2781224 RepID=A0ABR3PQN6_9PEZI